MRKKSYVILYLISVICVQFFYLSSINSEPKKEGSVRAKKVLMSLLNCFSKIDRMFVQIYQIFIFEIGIKCLFGGFLQLLLLP
jgi:hypothetical protein